jgi:exodeoxyribonuclease VII large subunit
MQRRPRRERGAQGPQDESPGLFDEPAAPAPPPRAPQPPPQPPAAPAAKRPQAAPAPEAPPWTVSALTAEIAHAVGGLGRVRVEGEVSDLRQPGSGHLYFQLKDAGARLSCALWKSQLGRFAFRPKDGDQVVAQGRLDVYAPRGTYNLVVEKLEPLGIGVLLARLEQLKAELRALGWFERRRPIPAWPRLIGVVTSRDGAALRDFLRTRSLRWPGYPVRLAHASVQGYGAAQEIAAALERLARSPGVDLIVLCRGGGSLEDLWAFNERSVAEAIWRSPVPVISGVGHESDTTLADLVADLRAHTPTDAAQSAIPDLAELAGHLADLGADLRAALDGLLAARAERLGQLACRPVLRDAAWIVGDRRRALADLAKRARRALQGRARDAAARLSGAHARLERQSPRAALERSTRRVESARASLARAAERRLERAQGELAVLARGLEATSPLAVLARGYSVTTGAAGAALTDARDARLGDELRTRLARGALRSRVEAIEPGEESGA